MFDDEARARCWLESEERVVREDKAGIRPWTHPDVRAPGGAADGDLGLGADPLFVDYADAWVATLRRRDGGELRGSTRRRIVYIVGMLKRAFPAPILLNEIDPQMIAEWYRHRRPESDWSFRDCCIQLHAMLRDAADPYRVGGQLIERDPFRVAMPHGPYIPSHDAPPVTPGQLAGLYDAFPGYTRIGVLLVALAGGTRTGELCALRVGDIDLEHRVLRVSFSVSRGDDDRGELRLGPTKTSGSHRTVPIPRGVSSMLGEHLREYCDDDPFSPLLTAKRGGRMSPRTLSHQMSVARESVGRPDLTFRMLRASHATLYMLEGGTLRETMDQLGHTTEQVAVRNYQRVVMDHRRLVADRLADMMLMSGPDGVAAAAAGVPDRTRSDIPTLAGEVEDGLDRVERLLSRLSAVSGGGRDGR